MSGELPAIQGTQGLCLTVQDVTQSHTLLQECWCDREGPGHRETGKEKEPRVEAQP